MCGHGQVAWLWQLLTVPPSAPLSAQVAAAGAGNSVTVAGMSHDQQQLASIQALIKVCLPAPQCAY